MNYFILQLLSNLYINSTINFIISLFFVEIIILLFRIKINRIKFLFRLIPYIKIIFDILFNYNLKNWAIINGIDLYFPIILPITWSINLDFLGFIPYLNLDFSFLEIFSISIADLIIRKFGQTTVYNLILIIYYISLFNIIKLVYLYITNIKKIKEIISSSYESDREIKNDNLLNYIKKYNIKILINSNNLFSPFSTGLIKRYIIIPENLYKNISNEEFYGLLLHEINHFKWYDLMWNIILDIIKAIFWFNPFVYYNNKKITELIELDCDDNALKNGTEKILFAELIKKCLEFNMNINYKFGNLFFKKESFYIKRIKSILDYSINDNKRLYILLSIFYIIILFSTILSRIGLF